MDIVTHSVSPPLASSPPALDHGPAMAQFALRALAG